MMLDTGCGDGILLDFFPKMHRNTIYVGVDFCLKKIRHARWKWQGSRTVSEVAFILADVENLPLHIIALTSWFRRKYWSI